MSWCAWSFRTLCARVDALRQNLPNVLVTPHQAFLTEEALCNIGATTVQNLSEFCSNSPLSNQVLPEADSQRTPRARAGGFGGALYM